MSEPWRSMKTAPKDGRDFVAVIAKATAYRRVDIFSWLADEGCWWTGGCLRYLDWELLGWVPLPAESDASSLAAGRASALSTDAINTSPQKDITHDH